MQVAYGESSYVEVQSSTSYEPGEYQAQENSADENTAGSDPSEKGRPEVLDLSGGNYNFGFSKITVLRNPQTGEAMEESYMYGNRLDRETQIRADENGTSMAIESEFDGQGHLGVFRKTQPNSTVQEGLAFDASEDYSGNFKIYENIESFGSGIDSEKSVSGAGYVAVNKGIGDGQKTRESGTGSYQSEEEISTNTGYISKEVNLEHEPVSQTISGGRVISQDLKWNEGVWSRNEGSSFIGEEYSGVDHLDKVTVVRGQNEMETEAEFSGKARYRTILEDEIEMDDQYEGDYSLSRKMSIQNAYRYYRQPHIRVTKDGELFYQDDKTLARYIITVENDGDRTLSPVYVEDLFPPGARFVNTTWKPHLASGSANWTLTHLSVGDRQTIEIWLDVTDSTERELVNRVVAKGAYGGGLATAVNFSALELDWLTCCLGNTLSMTKEGVVDPTEPNVVWYTLKIHNKANSTRTAKVTDHLPQGMVFLDSSVPFASYKNDFVTWNLIDVGPFETETIYYKTEALWSGRFVNQARIDSRSVTGPTTRSTSCSAEVEVGSFENERSAPGWQPPDWGFEYGNSGEYLADMTK